MATRNLTSKFITLRTNSRATRSPAPPVGSAVIDVNPESGGLIPPLARPLDQTDTTPEWVKIHEGMVKEIIRIKENIRTLQKLHAARLKVSFGTEIVAEQTRDVDNLTNELTSAILRCQNNLKLIATVGNDGSLNSQEKTTRLNVMRSLGAEVAAVNKHFRKIQKEFYRNVRDQEKIGEQYFSSTDGAASISLDDAMDNGLTPAQAAELQLIERQSNDREKEIIKIAQSVNELASIFKELNMLVIEQGSVLDRIDYNIETSLTKIKKGVVDLEAAEKASRKALAAKCILILGIIIALLFIVFVIKQSS